MTASPATTIRPSARDVGLVFLFATGVGLLLFAYRYLEVVASRDEKPFLDPFLCEMTGAYTGGLLFFAVRAMARRYRIDAAHLARRLPAHALGLLVYGVTATSLMWAARSVLFPLFGLGPYDYGRMPHRYFMEFPVQLLSYGLMVAAVTVADRYRAQRERLLRAAQLEAQLSQARLQALELQLQPHFLFNALNTISSAMYEDPEAADEMMGHLAELLRVSLRTDRRSEVPLRDELHALDHYLSLMRARFGDGLQVERDVEAETLDVLVPSLVLQPLVENAVRHGGVESVGRGRIVIAARLEQDRLRLEVRDQGTAVGPVEGTRGSGLGLSLTRERLRLLYADGHAFEAGAAEGGGFRVSIRLPARTAPRVAPPEPAVAAASR